MAVGDIFDIDKLRYIVLTESGSTGTVSVGQIDTTVTSGDIIIPETVINNNITYTVNKLRGGESGNDTGFRYNTNIYTIYIPKTCIDVDGTLYRVFEVASNLRSINIDSENTSWCSEDGVWYNKNKTTLYKIPEGKLDYTNKEFVIPDTVTTLRTYAGSRTKIRNIKFNKPVYFQNAPFSFNSNGGDSVVSVDIYATYAGNYLFNYNTYLKTLNIHSIESSGTAPFNNLPNLRTLTIGKDVNLTYTGSFYNCPNIETVNVDNQYIVDNFAKFFPQITSSTSPLKYVNIGDSVTSIGNSAFSASGDSGSIEKITLGKNITSIGTYALRNHPKLNYLNVPNGCTINSYSFGGHIFNLTISNCNFLNDANFRTTDINNLTLDNLNVTTLPVQLFDWDTGMRKLTINSKTLSVLGNRSFYACRNIASFRLPNTINTLGQAVFGGNGGTKSIIFEGNCPTSVHSTIFSASTTTDWKVYYYEGTIGWGNDFYGVTTQKVFRGERTVGNYTYKFVDGIEGTPNVSVRAANNVKLSTSDVVPQTVTIDGLVYTVRYVADEGFINQYNITSFNMNNQYIEIGKNAFKGCRNLATISNTNRITDIGEGAFDGCSKLTSFSIQSITFSVKGSNSNVYHPIPKNCFKDCKSLTSITLSNYTYEIQESAFENCESLTSITLPDEVYYIKQYAFKNCKSLQTVKYGTKLISINENAFENCENLQSFTATATTSSVNRLETIKDKAFMNCKKLSNIPFENIRDIGKYAFYNNNSLTSLTLPSVIDTIGDYAFANCNNLSNLINNTTRMADFGYGVFLNTNVSI